MRRKYFCGEVLGGCASVEMEIVCGGEREVFPGGKDLM